MTTTQAREIPLFTKLILSVITGAVLVACGGGSSDNSDISTASNGNTQIASVDQSAQPGSETGGNETGTPGDITHDRERMKALVSTATPATGYFVDSLLGDDANDGTAQKPWKTLSKLTTLRLKTGEGIYLRCGRIWRESVTLTWTQLVDGNIIAGYGDECAKTKATISGADDFSGGWAKTGNVWSRPVPAGTPKITRLFINDGSLRTAQWPNFTAVGREFAISKSGSATWANELMAMDADIPNLNATDLVGATIWVRTDAHYVEQRTVENYEVARGTFKLAAITNPTKMEGGSGYILQDKLWMLDAPGEFFHDTVNNKLYVYPSTAATQASLNEAKVEGSVRDNAFTVVNRWNLTIKHMAFVKTKGDGLFVNEAPGAVVYNVEASHNARSGVRFKLGEVPSGVARGGTLLNGTVLNNWVYGVDSYYAAGVDILSSYVNDTGTIDHVGMTEAALGIGAGGSVKNSDIQRSAFIGVRFRGTGGTTISNNDIGSYCLRLSDCGGIYTWNGPKGSQKTDNQSSLINDNRITAAKANMDGATGNASDIVVGIYLDDYSQGSTVKNNMVTGTPMGIYIHNGSNHSILSNKVWLTSKTALWANMSESDADYMLNNVFTGNELAPVASFTGTYPDLPKFVSSHAVWFKNNLTGLNSLARGGNYFSNNRILQLQGPSLEAAWVRSSSTYYYITANGWHELNPDEAEPSGAVTFSPYKATLGPELIEGGAFDNGLAPWSNSVSNKSAGTIQATSGSSGCSGLCALFNASSTSDTLASPVFNVTANTPYLISFVASYGGTARIRPWIGRSTTPWDAIQGSAGFISMSTLTGSKGDAMPYEGFFKPTATAGARVNMQMATLQVPITLDNISLRQITGYSLSNAKDWAVTVSAFRDAARTINYSDLGWPANTPVVDTQGRTVAIPLKLGVGESRLLLRADSPWRTK